MHYKVTTEKGQREAAKVTERKKNEQQTKTHRRDVLKGLVNPKKSKQKRNRIFTKYRSRETDKQGKTETDRERRVGGGGGGGRGG